MTLEDTEVLGSGCPGGVDCGPTTLALGVNNLHAFIVRSGVAYDKALGAGGWSPAASTDWASLGGPPAGAGTGIVNKISASTWGSGRIDLVARTNTNRLLTKSFMPGSGWAPAQTAWYDMGPMPNGTVGDASPKIVSWGPNRLDIFYRTLNGTIHQKTYTPDGWSAWAPLGGNCVDEPAIVSWGLGRLDLFCVNKDTSQLQIKSYSNGGWGIGYNLGAAVTGIPSVTTWGVNRLDIFVRQASSTSSRILFKTFNGEWSPPINGGFHDMGVIPGGLPLGPSSVSWGPGRLDVFVNDFNNNEILGKTFSNNAWQPSQTGWYKVASTSMPFYGPSVASWGPNRIDVFASTFANKVVHKYWNGGPTWLPVVP